MSEKPSGEMSAEEIRLRELRSFNEFNEEQARKHQISRDAMQGAETKHWANRKVEADGTGQMAENNSLGG